MTALRDDNPVAIMSAQDQARMYNSQRSAEIANIDLASSDVIKHQTEQSNGQRSFQIGGEAISNNEINSTNISSHAPDE